MFTPRCIDCGTHMEEMVQSAMFACPACGFRQQVDRPVPAEPSYDPFGEDDPFADEWPTEEEVFGPWPEDGADCSQSWLD